MRSAMRVNNGHPHPPHPHPHPMDAAKRFDQAAVAMDGRSCWVSGEDEERHWAAPGDVIVLPYGDRHVIGGEAPADPVSIIKLLDPLPWKDIPLLRHGGGGRRTDLVCGYLYSEDPLFDPAMRALPSVFVVRLPKDTGGPGSKRASPTPLSTHSLTVRQRVRSPPDCPSLS